MASIATVSDLWRYPVKSMRGEALNVCEITQRGMAGDRTHGLIDSGTLRIASAKRPQLWRHLLEFSATTVEPSDPHGDRQIRIELPGGRTILAGDPHVDAVLSAAIGRPVRLAARRPDGIEIERSHPDDVVRDGVATAAGFDTMPLSAAAPTGGFFDYAPLHVMLRASLDAIIAACPGADIAAWRYRPNIMIDESGAVAFAENGWVGRTLGVGLDVVVRVIAPTPRCAVPTLAQGTLGFEPRALRAVGDLNRAEFPGFGMQPCLGAYAEVIKPGRVRHGDPVRLLGA